MKVEKKLSDVVNRLNKTKEERKPNLQEEWEERDRQERAERKRREEEEVTYFTHYCWTSCIVEQRMSVTDLPLTKLA